ncbi:hypothetical protein [Micromonospora ureilytica]|uniref:hypothetical protein n=1 Tax=Micromonospora ureilytica TaxID=709868 RepID=UPI004039FE16
MGRHAEFVDEVVEAAVLAYLGRPEVAAKLIRRETPDLEALHQEARDLRRELDEAAHQRATKIINSRQPGIISKALRGDLERTEATIAAESATSPLVSLLGEPELGEAWRRLDISKRQTVVELIAEVVLLPTRRGRPAGGNPVSPTLTPGL